MAWRNRQPKQPTDEAKAQETAKQLNDEIEKWKNHRQLLDATLMETSFDQLNLVFQKFKEVNGKELQDVIADKFEGDKRNVYENLIDFCRRFTNNVVEYFSTRLYQSLNESAIDEQTLIRNILIHSETDLKEIKDQFQKSYNRDLADRIGKDISGPFEELLKRFVTGNVQPNQPK